MTIRSLYAGLSALRAQGQRLEVVQQNTANAATPGYRRQEVPLLNLAGESRTASLLGVKTGPRRSIDDPFVDRQLTHQRGALSYQQGLVGSYRVVESVFDPLGSEGLDAQFGTFMSSLRRLSAFPSGSAERRDALVQAEGLAAEFRRMRGAMVDGVRGLEDTAEDVVRELNRDLQEIADLDRAIQRERARGNGGEGGLVDQRDRLAAQVADAMDVRITKRRDGTLHLATVEGATLVEGAQARTVSLLRENGALSLRVSSGDSGQRLARPGGSLGAVVDVRNEVALERIPTLDQLAFDLAGAVNGVHQGSFGLDGSTGNDLFLVGATVEGAAQAIRLNPDVAQDSDRLALSSDPLLTGNNDGLLALLSVLDGPVSGGQTVGEVSRSMVQAIGSRIAEAERRAENIGIAVGQLQALQDATSGVSLEEEFVRLIETQRAFEAALKVITTADEMLQTVLSIKR